jgi:hypothetical protein
MWQIYIWRKANHVHKKQTNRLVREGVLHKDYYRKGSVGKSISGSESQGAWRQDKLIGGKPPVAT